MALRLPAFVKRSEPGVWVSAMAHGAILVAALAAFAAPPMPQAEEGIPVEVMTENQFSEMTRGQRDGARGAPSPTPRVDRVADTVEQKDPGEAKQDVPSPPQRPPEMKTAEIEEPPPAPMPPLRPALEQPQSVSVPAKPDQTLEAKQQEAARAEAAKKAAADKAAAADAKAATDAKAAAERAEKAAEAKAESQRREAAARELAKLVEKQEAEAEARAKAKAEEAKAEARRVAQAKADAEARAEMKRKVAEAGAEAEAKAAEAKAAETKAAEAKAAAEKAKAEAKRVADAKAAAAKAKADAEAKARAKAELAAKFDAGAISALVAQRQNAQSTGSTGREVQRVASLGTETGTAQKLSPSQRDALIGILQAQIEKCYAAPPGAASGIVLPVLDIRLNQDGSFSSEPRLMRGGSSAIDTAIAQSALRAVRRCAPYRIPAQFAPSYNEWKNIVATFDLPRT